MKTVLMEKTEVPQAAAPPTHTSNVMQHLDIMCFNKQTNEKMYYCVCLCGHV